MGGETAMNDQAAVIDWLSDPATHGGASVDRIDTHAAVVILTGARAFKLKRAVHYDYLDAATADRRRLLCEAEVQLNRRTVPDLYLGVSAVTREPGGALAFDGAGPPIDWVIVMRRFDQERLLDRMAARGALDERLMPQLAAAIAELHKSAERRTEHGGRAGMAWVVDGNAAGLAEFGRGWLDQRECQSLTARARAEVDRQGTLLDARRGGGFVRQCHGDLHLRNLVLLGDRPTLFDAVEFNDEIACIDVLYDLAFLLMDLWRLDLRRHANLVWNSYLAETDDLDALGLMPLFLSCRAAVRAKTSATSASLAPAGPRRDELRALAREYLAMAGTLLNASPPRMVAIGGLSGSGKSTLAGALALCLGSAPGALVLRTDEIRKRLCGVPIVERLGPAGYRPAVSARVYATVRERAARAARSGSAVIVDAVFNRAQDRRAIEELAASVGVPFTGVWLAAPGRVLIARASARRHDASDADAAVIRGQLMRNPGPITWRTLDASRGADDVLDQALAILK
jgi:aminoglycoside phosphotransferase family enzyme/predicted kinase